MEEITRNILILEDENALRNLIAMMLEARGWHCVAGAGNCDAIDASQGATSARIDAALLDLNAGELNGLQVAESLRRRIPDLPFVVMTGAFDGDLADRVSSLGRAAVLQKPFSIAALERTLESVVAI